MNEPDGRRGSLRPERVRRIARETGKTLTATVDDLMKDYLARKTVGKLQRQSPDRTAS